MIGWPFSRKNFTKSNWVQRPKNFLFYSFPTKRDRSPFSWDQSVFVQNEKLNETFDLIDRFWKIAVFKNLKTLFHYTPLSPFLSAVVDHNTKSLKRTLPMAPKVKHPTQKRVVSPPNHPKHQKPLSLRFLARLGRQKINQWSRHQSFLYRCDWTPKRFIFL